MSWRIIVAILWITTVPCLSRYGHGRCVAYPGIVGEFYHVWRVVSRPEQGLDIGVTESQYQQSLDEVLELWLCKKFAPVSSSDRRSMQWPTLTWTMAVKLSCVFVWDAKAVLLSRFEISCLSRRHTWTFSRLSASSTRQLHASVWTSRKH